MPDQSPETAFPKPPVPLFVFGVARSGTSYVRRLLDSHPQIRLSYEGCIVREGDYLYHRHRRLQQRADFDRLLEEFCRCEQDEPLNRWMLDVMRRYGDDLFRRHTQEPSCPKLIENIYMLPHAVACWGNKALRVEGCPQMLHLWPQAKAVILIRDPRAVYASQARLYGGRIKYSTIYWNLHARWTRQHATDPKCYLVVRYEDFVEDAPAVLKKILTMAGLWDPKVAEQMLAAHAPRIDSVNKWQASLSPREIHIVESYCFDEMKSWQYVPELADRHKPMGVVTKAWETLLENARWVPLSPSWWLRKRLLQRFVRTLRS